MATDEVQLQMELISKYYLQNKKTHNASFSCFSFLSYTVMQAFTFEMLAFLRGKCVLQIYEGENSWFPFSGNAQIDHEQLNYTILFVGVIN
jgi:hypothetical protein